VMPKLAIISAAGLALVINTSSSASAAQIVSEKDRLYCERQAAADWEVAQDLPFVFRKHRA